MLITTADLRDDYLLEVAQDGLCHFKIEERRVQVSGSASSKLLFHSLEMKIHERNMNEFTEVLTMAFSVLMDLSDRLFIIGEAADAVMRQNEDFFRLEISIVQIL